MLNPTGVAVLDDDVLASFFDPGSLQRGRGYASEDRVRLVSTRTGLLTAAVEGSQRNTYITRVEWWVKGPGVSLDDSCTCPLGGACKHVVATILVARRVEAARFGKSVPEHGWRAALGELLNDESPSTYQPLGLQFETDTRVVGSSRWGSQTSAMSLTATIRPVKQGAKERWIRSGVAWRDFDGYPGYGARNFDPRQVAAIRGMLSTVERGWFSSSNVAVDLSQFGADVWLHLAHAIEVGVTLVDASGLATDVYLAVDRAQATLDLQEADDGGVTMHVGMTLGDRILDPDPECFGLIGQPSHGIVTVFPNGEIVLAALAKEMPAGLARLYTSEALWVPASDVDELLNVYHPHLARHANVGSHDGSVAIVESVFDRLVLEVQRTALDAIETRWLASYQRGSATIEYPLHSGDDVTRDLEAERRAIADLKLPDGTQAELVALAGRPWNRVLRGADVITLLGAVVSFFEDIDQIAVRVRDVTETSLPTLREATGDPLVELDVQDSATGNDGTDWFDLSVEISVDGEDIPFASLFAALTDDQPVLILPSGTWLRLDRPEFARLHELIGEARGLTDDNGDGDVRINPYQTSWWDELAALGVVKRQSEKWSANLARMRDLEAPAPIEVPEGLHAELRTYQQEGLNWLAFLHRNQLGGILADDMGLGKTIQTLALCLHAKAINPDARFLVVAPTSVVENWRHEANRFAPELAVATIHATKARRGTDLVDAIAGADLVVTSYALFRLEAESYESVEWELLLLDEAQFVKNHQGKTYQCVRRLPAKTKLAITGTPMENSLMDLWALLSIVAPGLYPDPQRFSTVYRKPIERGEAPELLATLRRRIAPLMRRRTKDAVLSELPPKIEQTIEVELSSRHARIYQTQLQRQRQKVLGLVGDMQRNRFEIFKALTLLRQLSLDPALVDEAHDDIGSAKVDRLIEDLTQVLAEGHRALVFSQFTRYLARVKARLDAAGIDYAYLDGRTRRRDKPIDAFKSGAVPVFVISLKAGGVGLNLTEADYCFVLDPWWNPAVESQAVDRAHRIGQVNPVVVYRYVSTGTIEEKVMELKARKAALFADVMDADGALSGALSADDIRGLFDVV